MHFLLAVLLLSCFKKSTPSVLRYRPMKDIVTTYHSQITNNPQAYYDFEEYVPRSGTVEVQFKERKPLCGPVPFPDFSCESTTDNLPEKTNSQDLVPKHDEIIGFVTDPATTTTTSTTSTTPTTTTTTPTTTTTTPTTTTTTPITTTTTPTTTTTTPTTTTTTPTTTTTTPTTTTTTPTTTTTTEPTTTTTTTPIPTTTTTIKPYIKIRKRTKKNTTPATRRTKKISRPTRRRTWKRPLYMNMRQQAYLKQKKFLQNKEPAQVELTSSTVPWGWDGSTMTLPNIDLKACEGLAKCDMPDWRK